MKKKILKDNNDGDYYLHPYQTKGINVKDLFRLPLTYSNDADLGRAFRELIAEGGAVDDAKKYKSK